MVIVVVVDDGGTDFGRVALALRLPVGLLVVWSIRLLVLPLLLLLLVGVDNNNGADFSRSVVFCFPEALLAIAAMLRFGGPLFTAAKVLVVVVAAPLGLSTCFEIGGGGLF